MPLILGLVVLGIVAAVYLSVRVGPLITLGGIGIAALFVVTVIGFVSYPHLAVGATVLLFPLIPTLKVFAWSDIGPLKDLIVAAAVAAAVLVYAFERRRPDGRVLLLVGVLLGLYLIDIGGGHDTAWAQGVRLMGEPLLLLLVGLTLPDPQRTFRYAMGALVLIGCAIAAYGIAQQFIGEWTLVGWGYTFNEQVRKAYGLLRSWGTLDNPFDYAELLGLALVPVFFWLRRGPLAWGAGLLLLIGLGVSLVRGAVLFVLGLIVLLPSRRAKVAFALTIVAAALVAAPIALRGGGGSEASEGPTNSSGHTTTTTTTRTDSGDAALTDRLSQWKAALGSSPTGWVVGRGVGEVGTAAQRATFAVATPHGSELLQRQSSHFIWVDSGYVATVADVGLIGLAVLLAIFARLAVIGAAAAREGKDAGWVALGFLVVMLITALTESSFTSFPNAFLGMLLVGIALAATREQAAPRPPALSEASR